MEGRWLPDRYGWGRLVFGFCAASLEGLVLCFSSSIY